MRSKRSALVVVYILVLLGASGCLGPAALSSSDFPRLFEATYSFTTGETVEISFEEGFTVADEHLIPREAYLIRMLIKYPAASQGAALLPDPYEWRIYLDDKFRNVRFHIPCHEKECQYTTVDWATRGTLPPFGIGWPEFVEDSTISFSIGPRHITANVTMQRSGPDVMLGVTTPSSIPDGGYLGAGALFTYGDPPWLPQRIDFNGLQPDVEERVATLESYHVGDPLNPIEPWPAFQPAPEAASGLRELFPGSGAHLAGEQWSFQDMFEALLEGNSDARGLWEGGGCVRSVHMRPWNPEDSRLVGYERSVAFTIQGSDGQVGEWEVRRKENLLGATYEIGPRGGPGGTDECHNVTRGYTPVLGVQEFLAGSDNLPVSYLKDRPPTYLFTRGNPTDWMADSYGHEFYARSYVPAFVGDAGSFSVRPYNMVLFPATGTWQVALVHPDDIAAMDRGEFLGSWDEAVD